MRSNQGSIVFDVDSTLCTIEGIDELARIKKVERQIVPLTEKAMNGELTLDEVFARRLEIINPRRKDLDTLGNVYCHSLSPHALEVIKELQQKDWNIYIVSGGYKNAVIPLAEHLSISADRIFANSLLFDEYGNYQNFDRSCPLWRENGKKDVITDLNLQGNTILIGDGVSDLEAKESVDLFIGYGGVHKRSRIQNEADYFITDLLEILKILKKL